MGDEILGRNGEMIAESARRKTWHSASIFATNDTWNALELKQIKNFLETCYKLISLEASPTQQF
jgi:hypothetical protein